MNSFNNFFRSLLQELNIPLEKEIQISEMRQIISKINQYIYTNYDKIGTTFILDEEFEYLSEFHKFWERNHREILNPQIDLTKCAKIADILHEIYLKNGQNSFYELYDTFNLNPQEICKIRYFSANQEFRGTRDFKTYSAVYKDDPSIFDKQNIAVNPEDFLKNIGITSLSQNDKRLKYAEIAAKMLIEKKLEPYDLFSYFNRDVLKIREFLLSNRGSGFGNKKTDMFIRDMIVLNVWQDPINFEKIDVASDINTIKVALRTGILKTDIPLLSSFLDIFCYQYSLIDEINALSWRSVWTIWKEKYPTEVIESPCLIDYFVYRVIGKDFCNERLCIFECESKQHQFKWHSSRNKTCQICFKKGKKNKANLINKVLPCSDDEGSIVILKSEFVDGLNSLLPGIKECPFALVCGPKNPHFKKLNPPKSISILGQTGWNSARTRSSDGGGGLMA